MAPKLKESKSSVPSILEPSLGNTTNTSFVSKKQVQPNLGLPLKIEFSLVALLILNCGDCYNFEAGCKIAISRLLQT